MRLTPELMHATYDFLRETRPFNRWKLPPGTEIEFGYVRKYQITGEYKMLVDGSHRILLSDKMIGRTEHMIATMAHEMVHLKQAMMGKHPWHGAVFKRLAAQVCRHHGFDPKAF